MRARRWRSVLADNRALIASLVRQPDPTFATFVVPLEEAGHRLSRVWSPIGHLNAVANSAEMRAAYNECIPLLTAYTAEFGQNRRRCTPAMRMCWKRKAHRSIRRGAEARSTMRCAIFGSPGVDLPPEPKSRYRDVAAAAGAVSHQVFRERARRRARLHAHVTDSAELAGLPANARRSRRRDARKRNLAGLVVQTRSAHLHDGDDPRRERRSSAATSTKRGSRAPRNWVPPQDDSTTTR